MVLDSFAGTGTTGAVAHKMGRRWIIVELGEHCHTHIIPRLKKVINGEDKGGITETVGWKGGGGFRYYRLAPSLLEQDQFGNPVISKQYNAAMVAEAMCKLMGFTYSPSETNYWQHGHSTENDFMGTSKNERAGSFALLWTVCSMNPVPRREGIRAHTHQIAASPLSRSPWLCG